MADGLKRLSDFWLSVPTAYTQEASVKNNGLNFH